MKNHYAFLGTLLFAVACGENATSRYVPSGEFATALTQAPKLPEGGTASDSKVATPPNTPDCTALLAGFYAAVGAQKGILVREGDTRTLQVDVPQISGCSITPVLENADGSPATEGKLAGLTYISPDVIAADKIIYVKFKSASAASAVVSLPLRLLPASVIFVDDDGHWQGAGGNVYKLPATTKVLPDFSALAPIRQIISPNVDVADRNYALGIPGLDGLNEWFGIRFQFSIAIPTAMNILFAIESDDGARLSLDSNEILVNDGLHASRRAETPTAISLTEGNHALRLDYFQGPRDRLQVQLFWKLPDSIAWEIIPASAFR